MCKIGGTNGVAFGGHCAFIGREKDIIGRFTKHYGV
jgi:hypothetical protein